MRLSVADIDWSQLGEDERETLEKVVPLLEDGFSIAEIARELDVDAGELERQWENLAARVMALSGHVELPPLSDEEFEALRQSIAEQGQKNPILRGSASSGSPGTIVDGHTRLRICDQLRIVPWIVDVDGTADQLRSLGLVLNLARRHLSASSRRGIVKAELLRDPARSDRAIAAFVGVSHPTIAAVRRELEQTGAVERLSTRTDSTGRQQPARRPSSAPSEQPREKIVKVAIPIELVDEWTGVWVECRAFRLAERRAGVYELEVQLLGSDLADEERIAEIERFAEKIAATTGQSKDEALAELLATAAEVFAREISTPADLTLPEADWLIARTGVLVGSRR